MFKGGTW